MKYHTLLFGLLAVSSAAKIDLQDDHRASRRLSYSTNVVHDDPRHPHHMPHASSSINFKFNTHPSEADSQESPPDTNPYYRQPPVYTTPRPAHQSSAYSSPHDAQHHLNYSPSAHTYLQSDNQPDVHSYPQQHLHQSFNVGYSMRFKNDKKSAIPAKGQIITGSRKEEVSRPNQQNGQSAASFIGDDFVRNSLIDSKKQKISGIKAKYPPSYKVNVNTKQLLALANLSPKTQKQLAYLETAKSFGDAKTKSSPWQNLSPTVEIYHSKELGGYNQEGRSFDHSRALGKSEGFDHTDAMNYQTGSSNYFGPSKKLPLDTSLLRDPFLTTDKLTSLASSETIPIHFDTSLIQEMNRHIVDSNSYADPSLETATTNTGELAYKLPISAANPSAYYHQSAAPLTGVKYGFRPPMDNPLAAQQFGFEAPKQMFSGAINSPPKPLDGQRPVAYSSYVNQRHNDGFEPAIQAAPGGAFYNQQTQKGLQEAAFLMSAEQQGISPSESGQYISKDYSDYLKNVRGVENEFSGLKDPKHYNEYVQTKEYDFQKELDKVLFSSSIKPSENGGEQQHEATVQYKGPTVNTRDQFGSSFNAKFSRYHQQNNPKQASGSSPNKKRENPNQNYSQQPNLRQSTLNLKARVVREYIDTDLKPPPLQLNRDRNNANRRVQTKKFHI